MKTPGGGHRRPPHSVSTSPIAVRTRKHRHSRQTSRGSARSRPFFALDWPNDAGQVGGKVFATQERPSDSICMSPKPWKIFPRPSKIDARGLQNRARRPPRHHFLQTSHLRRLFEGCVFMSGSHFEPTWLQVGGPRPSNIEAKTRKNRCKKPTSF